MLDPDRQRAIRLEQQLVMVPDGVPMYWVRDERLLFVVHRDRPERIDRRQGTFWKGDRVFVRAAERLTIRVDDCARIQRILAEVGTESHHRYHRTEHVAGAVAANLTWRDLPSVRGRAERSA